MASRKLGKLAFYIDPQRFHIIPALKVEKDKDKILIEPVTKTAGGWRSAGFRVWVLADHLHSSLKNLEREISANIDRSLRVWRKARQQ